MARRLGGLIAATLLAVMVGPALPATAAPPVPPTAPGGGDFVGPVQVAPPPPRVASGGDSFAAGEGGTEEGPYLEGTDTATNRCHRSNTSPAEILNADIPILYTPQTKRAIDLVANTACGGATVSTFLSTGQYGEPPQVAAIPHDVSAYFLSLGAGDAQFSTLARCIAGGDCMMTREPEQTALLIGQLGPKLDAAYDAVRKAAPQAKVVIQLYPQMFPEPGTPQGPNCPYLDPGEAQVGHDFVAGLNTVIMERAQAHGFAVADASGHFAGHDVCSEDPYVYPPYYEGRTFYPNGEGRPLMAVSDFSALQR